MRNDRSKGDWLSVACVALAISALGCSTDPKSICEQVYPKIKQCVDALDCATISDATAKTKCEEKKQAYGSATYGESVAACKTAGSGVCDCVDKNKTAAEGYSGCALDPATCDCASAAADMGVSDGSVAD